MLMGSTAGYSGTPLARKLGLKAGMRVRLLNPPGHYWSLLEDKPGSISVDQLAEADDQKADFTHLFATGPEILKNAFARARAGMQEEGVVWASWPKKSSRVQSQIGRSEVMAAGKKVGLVDIKVCAVDDTWSGLKFVIPVRDRRQKAADVIGFGIPAAAVTPGLPAPNTRSRARLRSRKP
jgi:hypothetical protein